MSLSREPLSAAVYAVSERPASMCIGRTGVAVTLRSGSTSSRSA